MASRKKLVRKSEEDDDLDAPLKLDDDEEGSVSPSEEKNEKRKKSGGLKKHHSRKEEEEEESEEEGDFYQKDDFVVSDSEESEEEIVNKKIRNEQKRKKTKKNYSLDDDDLDLMQQNKEEGRKKLKRLETANAVKAEEESQSYQDEEDDSFIERKNHLKKRQTKLENFEDDYRSDGSLDDMDKKASDFVYRDLLEREEIKDKFLGVEDLKIIDLNGPERYFNRSWDERGGQSMSRDEAEWITRQMMRTLQDFPDLINAVSAVLKMIQISNHEIMYIHLYKRQSLEPLFVEKSESYLFEDLLRDRRREKDTFGRDFGGPRMRRGRDRGSQVEEDSEGEIEEDLKGKRYLGLKHLWQINDLDIEWSGLMKRKTYFDQLKHKFDGLRSQFPDMEEAEYYQDIKHIDYYIDYLLYQLRKRLTPEEYEEMKRMEHLMVDETLIGQNTFKSIVRATFAHQAFTCEVSELVYRFLLTPGQLAEHLAMSIRREEFSLKVISRPNTPLEAPLKWFSKKVNEGISLLKNPEKVHQSVIRFAAEELFYYPSIKLYLKNDYLNIVRISTEPTPRGRKDVDIYNMYFPVKRLKDLKLEDLMESKVHPRKGCLWLLMKQAEQKGYIKIHFKTEWDTNFKDSATANTIFMDLGYKSIDKTSEFWRQWDEIREEVFDYLIRNLCLPSFEKELQGQLSEKSEKFIIEECSKKFRKMINLQPSLSNEDRNLDAFDVVSYMSVMGITLDPNNPGHVACVMLDQDGEYKSEIVLTNFIKRRSSTNTTGAESYEKDLDLLKTFVNVQIPEKIVIGSNCIQASYLKAVIIDLLGLGKSGTVTYGDMTVPNIWAKSDKASETFPESHFLVKQAVSLARMAQDPTAEVLNLWNVNPQKNGLTYVSLHPLQDMVPQAKLLYAYDKVAMEIVNKAGVDLNRVIAHEHLQAPLIFVCGLGPRKVSHLVSEIKSKAGGIVLNRKQLGAISCLRPMKDSGDDTAQKFPVYRNAIAFLKIIVDPADERLSTAKKEPYKTSDAIEEEEGMHGIHVLDRTRIHPSMYQVAEKFARHILKIPDQDRKPSQEIFREIMKMKLPSLPQERIARLEDEIESYINNLYINLHRNMRNYCYLIIHELTYPFRDYRPTIQASSEKFASVWSMSRISPWILTRGSLIDVMIKNVVTQNKENSIDEASGRRTNDFLSVVTNQGIPGIVDLTDFQENGAMDKEDLHKKFVSGSYITCKIKDINNTNMKLSLSAKLEDINNFEDRLSFIHSVYGLDRSRLIFDGLEDFKKYNPDGEQKKNMFVTRSITHPNFKNYSYQQALTVIKKKQMGDVRTQTPLLCLFCSKQFIIRPSSSDKNALAVVWLIYPENVVNLTLKEGPKGPNESISKELTLVNGREKFTSLDEFINAYIKRVNFYVEGIIRHNKFFPSKDSQGVDEELRKVKAEYDKKNEALTPYLFSFRQEIQQYLILSYLFNNEIKREYIKLKPKGLFFHGQEFQDLVSLVNFFKKNFYNKDYQKWASKVAKDMNDRSASVLTTRNTPHAFSGARRDENQSVDRWNGAASVHGGNTPRSGGFRQHRGFHDRSGKRGGERGGIASRDSHWNRDQSRSRSREKRRPNFARENQRDWAKGGETPVNRVGGNSSGWGMPDKRVGQGWGDGAEGWEAAEVVQNQTPSHESGW